MKKQSLKFRKDIIAILQKEEMNKAQGGVFTHEWKCTTKLPSECVCKTDDCKSRYCDLDSYDNTMCWR
ncbi:MAG: hypothetical protein ACEPOV_08565 [Hyphomicrobiales bacterium]